MYPTEEETALWVALNLAQRSIFAAMDSTLKSRGLPPLRWYDVLWAIERAGNDGLRPFEMERSLLFEQSNLSRLLRRMVIEELVEDSVCKADRRGKVLRITGKGERVRKEMWQVYGPLIHAHMGRLSKGAEVNDLQVALSSLILRGG